jgi:hypothetical protein
MPIVVPHLTNAFLRRNMIKPMGLLLSHFFFYHFPSASHFVGFSGCMPTTASKTIMLHSNCILCFFEGKSHFFSSKYITIEVFTKDLSRLIINFVLRINHNNIFCSNLIKYLTNDLRMARINEYKL